MKGAREYADLFETGQYGKLYITSSSHARGRTFRIQVLPEGEKASPNGRSNLCTNENAVVVYGVIGGNPGWTEYYGWLHKGKWQEDFRALVEKRKAEIAAEKDEETTEKAKIEAVEKIRVGRLLADY